MKESFSSFCKSMEIAEKGLVKKYKEIKAKSIKEVIGNYNKYIIEIKKSKDQKLLKAITLVEKDLTTLSKQSNPKFRDVSRIGVRLTRIINNKHYDVPKSVVRDYNNYSIMLQQNGIPLAQQQQMLNQQNLQHANMNASLAASGGINPFMFC